MSHDLETTHMIIEDAPDSSVSGTDEREPPAHIYALESADERRFRRGLSVMSSDIDRPELKWNADIESRIQEYQTNCMEKHQAHDRTGKRKLWYSRFLAVPALCVNAVIGTYGTEELSGDWVRGLSLFATVLGIIQMTWKLETGAEKHSQFAGKYKELFDNIKNQLLRPKPQREAADTFLLGVQKDFTRYEQDEPNV